MGRKLINLTGLRYERLIVIRYLGRFGHAAHWLCKCDCGNETRVNGEGLKSGRQKSCGCYKRDRAATLTLKHGARRLSGSPGNGRISNTEYKIWDGMKQRCHNEASPGYMDYGGRGIEVCAQWRNDFEAFLDYMGPRPSSKHSIDRYPDQSGNYEPGNVRWATWTEQARNRRSNKLVAVNGAMMPIAAAAEIIKIDRRVIARRLRRGWSTQRALSEPLDVRKSHVRRLDAELAEHDAPRACGESRSPA